MAGLGRPHARATKVPSTHQRQSACSIGVIQSGRSGLSLNLTNAAPLPQEAIATAFRRLFPCGLRHVLLEIVLQHCIERLGVDALAITQAPLTLAFLVEQLGKDETV